MSRAIDALIIVGNGKYLSKYDANWYKLIQQMFTDTDYKGCIENLSHSEVQFDTNHEQKMKDLFEGNEIN